jgi:hypothetical protein
LEEHAQVAGEEVERVIKIHKSDTWDIFNNNCQRGPGQILREAGEEPTIPFQSPVWNIPPWAGT